MEDAIRILLVASSIFVAALSLSLLITWLVEKILPANF